MRLKRIKIGLGLFVLAIGLAMTGCHTNEPTETMRVPLSLCLPANEVQNAARMPIRRSIGDPGQKEEFRLPKYIYIFIVYYDEKSDKWKLWEQKKIDDADEYWHKEYYSGGLMGSGDSIYRYTRDIIKPLEPGDKFKGKIYVIASAEELTLSPASLTNKSSTEAEVLELKFNTEMMQNHLHNIYSTPYNYQIDGKYYGFFSSKDHNVPYINLMLYHVAAKMDINWTVNDGKRPDRSDTGTKSTAVRLTDMKAQYLFNGYAYCFKPMRNEVAAKLASGYERVLITPTDEGLWWEGRSYFYTIPYIVTGNAGYFPLQMFMRTNGSTGAGYKPTLNLEIDTSSVFVPWMRADFNINQALTDGVSPTINVGD